MRRIRQFAKSMFLSWGSGMSGIPSIPVAVAAFWVSNPMLKAMYASLAAILLLVSSYKTWAKENDRVELIYAELQTLKRAYLDERPQIAFTVHAPETAKTWNDLRNTQSHSDFFELQHIGGRTATWVKIAPIASASGRFSLHFSEIPVLSGPHPITTHFTVNEGDFVPIEELNNTIEMLLVFFSDNPKGSPRLEFDVVVNYQDGDTERVHRQKMFWSKPGPRLGVGPADVPAEGS